MHFTRFSAHGLSAARSIRSRSYSNYPGVLRSNDERNRSAQWRDSCESRSDSERFICITAYAKSGPLYSARCLSKVKTMVFWSHNQAGAPFHSFDSRTGVPHLPPSAALTSTPDCMRLTAVSSALSLTCISSAAGDDYACRAGNPGQDSERVVLCRRRVRTPRQHDDALPQRGRVAVGLRRHLSAVSQGEAG